MVKICIYLAIKKISVVGLEKDFFKQCDLLRFVW